MKHLHLQKCRQQKTLGEINEKCLFDYDFGHFHIFNVTRERQSSQNPDKPRQHVSYSVSGFEVYSEERPNYTDFNVFIGAIKLFQKFAKKTYSAGVREIGSTSTGKITVPVTGLSLSKNQFCGFFGKIPSGKSHAEIYKSLDRLRSTTLYQYKNNELVRTFRLVTDFKWEVSTKMGEHIMNPEIFMDTTFLNECLKREFYVRWKAIQGLKSQVAKAVLLYVDCNNLRKPTKGEWNPWQPYPEHRLFKFIYNISKPKFINYSHKAQSTGSAESQLNDFYDFDFARRKQYAIEMKAYNETCREYRRQVHDAFTVLKEQGLIDAFARVKKNKAGVTTERKLWLVKKNNLTIRKQGDIDDVEEEDDFEYPF